MASLFRRVCAGVALVTFLAGFGLGTFTPGHLGPEDDAACEPVAFSGFHSTAQFEAVVPAVSGAHCAFCHWQRVVVGADLAGLGSWHAVLEPVARILPVGTDPQRSSASDDHPSRAPPSLSI